MTEDDSDIPVGFAAPGAEPAVAGASGVGEGTAAGPVADGSPVPATGSEGQPHDGPPSAPPVPPGRRRWPWIVFVAFVLVVAVASRWNLNYYALEPGTAQSVQQFITVPPAKSHPVTHPVLLTDVEIGRVTALTYLYFKLHSDTVLEPLESVTGGTAPSQLNTQGDLEMSQAETYAKTSALRRLGYQVNATPAGAVVTGTFSGTPAYPVLGVGDVITAVDGTPTLTAAAVTGALAHYHPPQTVTLTVRKGGTAPPAPVAITLKDTEVYDGGPKPVTLDLGIEVEDQVDYTYPFPVHINVTNIGGPSAGLAMTLGVMDALTSGSLTGARTVAATGTMDAEGDVGDVGGVAQKTVAVERAGASIFMVPPQEYKAAMSEDRPGLKVYAVSTLNQALAVLAAHGGTVPPAPPAPTPTTTVPG
jgi:PDZ domain-containing protein